MRTFGAKNKPVFISVPIEMAIKLAALSPDNSIFISARHYAAALNIDLNSAPRDSQSIVMGGSSPESVQPQGVIPKNPNQVTSKIDSFFEAVKEKATPAPTVDLSNY